MHTGVTSPIEQLTGPRARVRGWNTRRRSASCGLVAAFCAVTLGCRAEVPPPESREMLNAKLIVAAKTGRLPELDDLVRRGADPNALALGEHYQDSALIIACKNQNLKAVELLLRLGADPDLREHGLWYSYTPLMAAATMGDAEIVQRLIDSGANVHARQGHPTPVTSALTLAATYGRTAALQRLLAAGATVSPTPIYSAISYGHVACVRLLIEARHSGCVPDRNVLIAVAKRLPHATRGSMIATIESAFEYTEIRTSRSQGQRVK